MTKHERDPGSQKIVIDFDALRGVATNLGVLLLLGLAQGIGACGFNAVTYADAPSSLTIDAAPTGCANDQACTGTTAVCDLGDATCVVCTKAEAAACIGTTPLCGSDDACHACSAHADCASGACLPDGSCGDDASVAYVDPAGTDNSSCVKALPCTSVTKALATRRPFVKFTGTTDQSVTVSGQTVTFLADRAAKLTRSTGAGAILTVSGDGTSLTIYDLSISDGPNNASGYGVVVPIASGAPAVSLIRATVSNNPGGGISTAAGSLIVEQSTISSNPGGGISVSGTGTAFNITNNFIVYNGTAGGDNASQVGGATLIANTPGSTFLFNTVAFNACAGAIYRGGVTCTGANVSASGNLIYKNAEGTTTSAATQDAGGCQFGDTLVVVTDAADLGFKSPVTSPLDFHLTSATPHTVVDAAGQCAVVDPVDLDGDVRPQGSACDFGADEYKP